jgi:hypothetical protein
MFCLAEGRALAPATEQQLVAYVGWLAQEREAGRRSVSSGSLPQYLTAARTVTRSLFGGDTATTKMPLLSALQRAYAQWEAEKYPSLTHRGGIPADVVQAIWAYAIQSETRGVVRDGAAVVLAYVLGLRESSLLSLPKEGVKWDEQKVTAHLVVVKGKALRHTIPGSYQRCATDLPSPVDLVARWGGMRSEHPLFFGISGEPVEWRPGGLCAALRRCLAATSLSPPAGSTWTSLSLRVGAHTERPLLGQPVEARKAWFGWGPDSDAMTALYFDRQI